MIDDNHPMNHPPKRRSQQSPSDNGIDEASRELCMRYLLGDVSAEETSTILHRLRSEPTFADEMAAQSDLICHLATPQAVSIDHAEVSRTWLAPVESRLMIIVSIAASLLLTAVLWSLGRKDSHPVARQVHDATESPETDEELLVALEWADGPLSLALNAENELSDEPSALGPASDELAGDLTGDLFGDSDQEPLDPSDDSVLRWMMAGVMAGDNLDG